MKPLALGRPPFNTAASGPEVRWLTEAMAEVRKASHEQVTEQIADAYTLSNFTETRTLDASTATASDIANVLATLLWDMQNRGVKRG
ncbi:hypothetical protein [Pseudohoeflea coraliihabitans]|uniref:Uncharacterized protein n=1 Tax=Pseudohoeflea coraliihabitans TaxID=2860393 RepID=A0ABS6WUS6_9HYPH|nr:hypothetical protein [Pseudohoeflea sp. DP4N28-3]MBW3099192.1 hypothetical protein [Pseudohoeflea sp. DP4N28-3]